MTLSNIQPQQAWQMVIENLRINRSLGLFRTYVQDIEFISLENGTLTIGAANLYACNWLAGRLTSTPNRISTSILDQPVTVQFMVREKPLPKENDSIEEKNT
jgi:hypothetical protein